MDFQVLSDLIVLEQPSSSKVSKGHAHSQGCRKNQQSEQRPRNGRHGSKRTRPSGV